MAAICWVGVSMFFKGDENVFLLCFAKIVILWTLICGFSRLVVV
jgi:hypothetical protein